MNFNNILGYGIAFIAKNYFTKEPIQLVLPMSFVEPVYLRLKNHGFYDLKFLDEYTRKGKLWSLAKNIGNNYELHVRAIKLGDNLFNVSSHVDIGPRHSIRHVFSAFQNQKKSHSLGQKLTKLFLI